MCVCACGRACVCACVCEKGSGRKVRKEVRGDKEEWMNETIQEMDEDMRHHRNNNRVTLADTIPDEAGQPLQKAEEGVAR